MYSVRKAINYVPRNGKWMLHSLSFIDGKGRTRKFPTVEAAEAFALDQMNSDCYNEAGSQGYIVYCTIYQGNKKIKRIDR